MGTLAANKIVHVARCLVPSTLAHSVIALTTYYVLECDTAMASSLALCLALPHPFGCKFSNLWRDPGPSHPTFKPELCNQDLQVLVQSLISTYNYFWKLLKYINLMCLQKSCYFIVLPAIVQWFWPRPAAITEFTFVPQIIHR